MLVSLRAALETAVSRSNPVISFLDEFSDEVVGEILLFCDFPTAVRCCNLVSKSLRNRIQHSENATLGHVWRLIYQRHKFAPVEGNEINARRTDYLSEIRSRRRLLFNLLQTKKKGYNRCFNLPNRFFFFKPIIPQELLLPDGTDDDEEFLDQPPVLYECDSFVLTSPGAGGECILLDPFDGRLSVIKDIVSHCVASDEAMMEQAMVRAADAISSVPRSRRFLDWKDDEIAGHCFEESVVLNHTRHEYPPPPCQELLKADDVFFFDIAPYFPDREASTQNMTDEFDISYVGTDAKPILDPRCDFMSIQGFMVGVGRTMTNLAEENMVCTELTLWTRQVTDPQYDVEGSKMLCRFPWSFGIVDFEPLYKRLFVSFLEGDGPADSKSIVVYPMIQWSGDDKDYFAQPLAIITCRQPIASMTVDATGETLLVGCGRTLEVWHTAHLSSRSSSSGFRRLQVLHVTKCLRASISEFVNRVRAKRSKSVTNHSCGDEESSGNDVCSPSSGAAVNNDNDDEEEVCFRVLTRLPDLPHLLSPVDSILIPKHLRARTGFVTLQYDRNEGTSLLLWRHDKSESGEGKFKVVSLINLRLSCRRKPRVTYDGNRLIVFGEDHIGMIILIYHISNGDIHFSEDELTGEHSGGVYNLSNPPQVRFSNRIRHAALSGIDRFDSIHLTANERFIIVNTKTGHLLGGASCPFSEGILVIDLEEATR